MIDDEGAPAVRAELDRVAAAAPGVRFTTADVLARGRRRRNARRAALTTGLAAALALVVAVPAVALRGPGGTDAAGRAPTPIDTAATPTPTGPALTPTPSLTGPVPTATPTPTPTLTGSAATPTTTLSVPPTWEQPPVPGLSTGQARGLARTCARAANIGDDRAKAAPHQRIVDNVGVYNAVRDAAGTYVLVYGPETFVGCNFADLAHPEVDYLISAGGLQAAEWMPGDLSMEEGSSNGAVRTVPGYQVIGGRVSAEVAEVVVRIGGEHARVPVRNGTYLARFVHSTSWQPVDSPEMPGVTGLDVHGRVVGAATYTTGCIRTPDGTVIYNDHAPGACRTAVRWR